MASGSGTITLYADSFLRLRFRQHIENFVDPFQSPNINTSILIKVIVIFERSVIRYTQIFYIYLRLDDKIVLFFF